MKSDLDSPDFTVIAEDVAVVHAPEGWNSIVNTFVVASAFVTLYGIPITPGCDAIVFWTKLNSVSDGVVPDGPVDELHACGVHIVPVDRKAAEPEEERAVLIRGADVVVGD